MGTVGRIAYFTGQGFAFHICSAYSVIVRSLENRPEVATLRIAFPNQSAGSAQVLATRA